MPSHALDTVPILILQTIDNVLLSFLVINFVYQTVDYLLLFLKYHRFPDLAVAISMLLSYTETLLEASTQVIWSPHSQVVSFPMPLCAIVGPRCLPISDLGIFCWNILLYLFSLIKSKNIVIYCLIWLKCEVSIIVVCELCSSNNVGQIWHCQWQHYW